MSTWKLHGTKKKLPTNYKELPALILGIHQEIWEVPAPKKAWKWKFLGRSGGSPRISPLLGQSFKRKHLP